MKVAGQAYAPRISTILASLLAPIHDALNRYMARSGLVLHAAPGTLDGIASFLVDNPTADVAEGSEPTDYGDEPGDSPDNSPARKPAKQKLPAASDPDETLGEEEDDPEELDEPEEEDDPDAEDENASPDNQKFKVTVKGADGADETLEVPLKELTNGYMRHSDYTRSKQQLSTEKTKAFEIVSTKVDEATEVARRSHAAIVELAGLKTPQEMAALAAQDRGAYVEEKARQEAVLEVLARIEREANHTRDEAQKALHQRAIEAREEAWQVLDREGVKREELVPLFQTITKHYGVPQERFKNITDPALVLIMRDAARYRALKSQTKAQAKAKLTAAPPVPKARQQLPRQARVNRDLDKKFHTGKAKLNDLTAWVRNNT